MFVTNQGAFETNPFSPGSPAHVIITHEDVDHSLVLSELPNEDGYSAGRLSTVKPNGRTLTSNLRLQGNYDSNRRVWNCGFIVTELQMRLFELLIDTQGSTRIPCTVIDLAVQVQNATTWAVSPTTDELGIETGYGAYLAWVDTDQGYKSPYFGHVWWLLQFQAESVIPGASSGGSSGGSGGDSVDMAFVLNRANHTGTQLAASISNFATVSQGVLAAALTAGSGIVIDKTNPAAITISSNVTGTTNLSKAANETTVTVESSTGTNATLTAATASEAGIMTAADRQALTALPATIQSTVGAMAQAGDNISLDYNSGAGTLTVAAADTDLGMSRNATSVTVESSTGTNATLMPATVTDAGIMTAAQVTQLQSAFSRANHTGTQPAGTISDFTESVHDTVAALLTAGTGISLDYDDTGNTLTVTGSAAADPADLGTTTAANDVTITVTGNAAGDTVIPRATTSTAGVMSSADFAKLAGIQNGATVNFPNNFLLNRGAHTGTQDASTITNLDDAIDGILVAGPRVDITANPTTSTIMIEADPSNLSLGAATGASRTISISTGNDVSIPAANGATAGLYPASDFTKLQGIEAGATKSDLSFSRNSVSGTIANSGGDGVTLPVATSTQVGLLAPADFTKLQGIATGATVTNLSLSRNSTSLTVINSGGGGVVLPEANGSQAGVMSAASFNALQLVEVTLTMQNGWVAFGSGYGPAKASRVGPMIMLSGLIKSGTVSTNITLSVIPAGYRPSVPTRFLVETQGGEGVLLLESDGRLSLQSWTGAPAGYLNIQGAYVT